MHTHARTLTQSSYVKQQDTLFEQTSYVKQQDTLSQFFNRHLRVSVSLCSSTAVGRVVAVLLLVAAVAGAVASPAAASSAASPAAAARQDNTVGAHGGLLVGIVNSIEEAAMNVVVGNDPAPPSSMAFTLDGILEGLTGSDGLGDDDSQQHYQERGALGGIAEAIGHFFGGGDGESDRCMAPSMEDTLHVAVSPCDSTGTRTVETAYHPSGHQGCHNNLLHPIPPSCTRECPEGQALLWHPKPRTFNCQVCPAGKFSVGGGHIQEHWPRGLPEEFETTCFSLDPNKFAQGQQTWREKERCSAWTVGANGTALTSGNNTGENYLESYLILNLRFVRPGSLWFRYRVDAEEYADGLLFRMDDIAQALLLFTDHTFFVDHILIGFCISWARGMRRG